jgi:hypothetical protein
LGITDGGERKAYIGMGLGADEERDQKFIAGNGAKFTPESAQSLFRFFYPQGSDALSSIPFLLAGIKKACDESDYCYVCDNNPSYRHAPDCAYAKLMSISPDM